jgi:hypothetical protein
MAALQTPQRRPAHRQAAARWSAPRLVVIEGGRSTRSRQQQRVYLRRRCAVLASLILVGWWVGAAFSTPEPPPRADRITGASYLVQPGDTLWEVAHRLDRGGDVRAVVDRLAEVNGGDRVLAGQRLIIPEDLRS